MALALQLRDLRVRRGQAQSVVVAEIAPDGARGHRAARTFTTPGHWTVWGESEEFVSVVLRVYSI